jgi:hypothetical protein
MLGAVLAAATAQTLAHPVITEAFLDPSGTNGPIGTNPANPQQEFIEIDLPTAASLAKDALNLTLYDVEGDFSSTHRGHVNWRIDLPTSDLDPSNGLTLGAAPRPPNGLVVVGWLDYVGDPPVALAGTRSMRVPLVTGGFPPVDFAFVALNGN